MVYAKFMSRGFSNEYVIVTAPTVHALHIFASREANKDPNSRTVRIQARSKEIRDWKKLQERMAAFSEHAIDDAIHLLPNGQRDGTFDFYGEEDAA